MSGYDEGQKEADLRNELSTCLTSHWRYCMAGVLSGEWTTTTTTTTNESSCFVSNCSFRFVWNEIFFFFLLFFFLFLPRLVYSFLLHQMNFTTDFSLTFSSSSCSHWLTLIISRQRLKLQNQGIPIGLMIKGSKTFKSVPFIVGGLAGTVADWKTAEIECLPLQEKLTIHLIEREKKKNTKV